MTEGQWRTHRLELDDQTLREWDAVVLHSGEDGIVLAEVAREADRVYPRRLPRQTLADFRRIIRATVVHQHNLELVFRHFEGRFGFFDVLKPEAS